MCVCQIHYYICWRHMQKIFRLLAVITGSFVLDIVIRHIVIRNAFACWQCSHCYQFWLLISTFTLCQCHVKLCNREMCDSQNGFDLSQLLFVRKLCWQQTSWNFLHQFTGHLKPELVSVGYLKTLHRLTAKWRKVWWYLYINHDVLFQW